MTVQPASPWDDSPEAKITLERIDLKKQAQQLQDENIRLAVELESARTGEPVHSIEGKVTGLLGILEKKLKKAHVDDDALVAVELINIEAREEAKKIYRFQNMTADFSVFDDAIHLDDALQLPEEPLQWRIRDLLMVGHITTVTAPAKAGKTVLQVNRVKSYVDGNALFGRYQVFNPVQGNVAVWNYELMPQQMHDWFRRAGIVNRHKIFVMNMRGAGLHIQNEMVANRAIEWLRENNIEILEIDPLQAAFVGSVNNDDDAAEYINALQRIQRESGVKDIILTTHMGHGAKTSVDHERSIGSARWEGFADNMWIYKRDGDIAYLRIDKGRMDPVPEFGLSRDPATNLLTHLGDKSGTAAKKEDDLFKAVVLTLAHGEPVRKTTGVVEMVGGTDSKKKKKIREVLSEMQGWGILSEEMVKQESGQPAAVVQMSTLGCFLFSRMRKDGGLILERPLAVWSEGDEVSSDLSFRVKAGALLNEGG